MVTHTASSGPDLSRQADRKLEFAHVGHWGAPPDSEFSGSVAVEIDPGGGSSVVVFVQAPNRRDVPDDFHPDDQVCLVIPEDISDLLSSS